MLLGGWKVEESGSGWNRTENSLSQEVGEQIWKGRSNQALGICKQCKIWDSENGWKTFMAGSVSWNICGILLADASIYCQNISRRIGKQLRTKSMDNSETKRWERMISVLAVLLALVLAIVFSLFP